MNFYLKSFAIFLKIGLFTIGGGYAMVPLIQDENGLIKKTLSTYWHLLSLFQAYLP